MDRTTEDIKIEYRYEPTTDAEERVDQALDLILRIILSDSFTSLPGESVAPPAEVLR